MSILKLSKETDINGEKVKEIEYNFEDLRGDAVETAVKALQKEGYVPTVQEVDPLLQTHLFAQAAGLDYTDIKRLSAKDFLKAGGKVRDFFLEESEDLQQKNI